MPVNLMETLDPDSSGSYIRRVVARTLGHALAEGLTWKDVRALWVQLGFDSSRWPEYIPSVEAAAYG